MTIDEEKFWNEISEEWRKKIMEIEEEENASILLPDEITITMFKNASKRKMTYNQATKILTRMVDRKEATVRSAKINGHRTNIYRLIT